MEDKEVLVKVEGVSKKFCKDLKTSLKYGIQDLFSNLGGNKGERNLREKEFWAVKDVSFKLKRGECLGLIGHNGAGKSTLLKILNGLIKPDAGKVTIKGRIGALIELGAGFNPILTGRENIFNNGAILGFSKKEISEKVDEIIDFAELREFIDMPVQNYSSGMKVRLGFAIAAQMEPDVLIIDEVLAVGDLGFTLKCFKRIDEILPKTAIVFVSHSMPMISRISNRIVLLERGQSVMQGDDIAKAIDKYYMHFAEFSENIAFDDHSVSLQKIDILNSEVGKNDLPCIPWNSSFQLFFRFMIHEENMEVPIFKIIIMDKEQRPVAVFEENKSSSKLSIKNGILEFEVVHDNLQLSKGIYTIDLLVAKGRIRAPLLRINSILTFQILHEKEIWPPFLLSSRYNPI